MKILNLCLFVLMFQSANGQEDYAMLFFKKLKIKRVHMVYEGLRQIPVPENTIGILYASHNPQPLNDPLTRQLVYLLKNKWSYRLPKHIKEGNPACIGPRDVFMIYQDTAIYRLELDVACHGLYLYKQENLLMKDFFLSSCEKKLWVLIRRLRTVE